MIKLFAMLTLLTSMNLFAGTITDKTCDIYLPVNDVLLGWGENKQLFMKKGYHPIEVYIETLIDTKKVPNNALVAEIEYSWEYGSISLGNGYKVELGIERMRNNRTAEMTNIYRKRVTAKFERMAETRAFRGMPNCEMVE